MAILTVGIDLAKSVFAWHDVNDACKPELPRPSVPRPKVAEVVGPSCRPSFEPGRQAGSASHRGTST